jgi:hypothetical protein
MWISEHKAMSTGDWLSRGPLHLRERHNDIYRRMPSVVSKLTPMEMRLLAIYYGGR